MFIRFSKGFLFSICLFIALGCLFACGRQQGTIDESTSQTENTNTTLSTTEEEDPFSHLSFKIIGKEEKSYSVIGYKEFNYLDTNLVIPSEYKGLPVTSIGENAFNRCNNLINVEIPSTVTMIGKMAFYSCSSLQNVVLSEGLKSIGVEAFYECSSLNNCNIPSTVYSIGARAFSYCESLKSIEIPSGVITIQDSVFSACWNLRSVIINEGVINISSNAFCSCINLMSIVLPSSIKCIEDNAFSSCDKLVEVYNLSSLNIMKGSKENGYIGNYAEVIHNSLEEESVIIKENDFVFKAYNGEYTLLDYVGNENYLMLPNNINGNGYGINCYAFYARNNLVNVIIPEGVTNIGNSAFKYCKNLTSVIIPSTVKGIEYGAFFSCSRLKNVIIFEGTANIGDYAFYGCQSLKSIDIPSTVLKIGRGAFYSCKNLREVLIPYPVKEIGEDAFGDCWNLTNITIPSSVVSIGDDAFSECNKLKEVYNLSKLTITCSAKVIHKSLDEESILTKTEDGFVFMSSKKSLGKYEYYLIDYFGDNIHVVLPSFIDGHTYEIYDKAFYCNDSIISVVIPEGVTRIGDNAFYECENLMRVTIPSSVTYIDDDAFEYCRKLVEIYNLSNLDISKTSYVGGYIGYYVEAIHNSLEEDSILVESEDGYIFIINNDKYYLAGYLGEDNCLELPSSINGKEYGIFKNAFYGRDDLISINIPFGVTSIGDNAFLGCKVLTSITIPSSVTRIGDYAFCACNKLINVDISKGVKEIGIGVFGECDDLLSIVIPEGVTSIKEESFGICESLRYVIIPEGVLNIEKQVFILCDNLTSVVLPSSLVSIGEYSFSWCPNIDNIYYRGTPGQYASLYQDHSEIPSDKVVYYSDEKPIDTINKYWHFDEKGKIVIWQN